MTMTNRFFKNYKKLFTGNMCNKVFANSSDSGCLVVLLTSNAAGDEGVSLWCFSNKSVKKMKDFFHRSSNTNKNHFYSIQ